MPPKRAQACVTPRNCTGSIRRSRQQVEAAGFEFVGESQILRNPNDDHTLPVFDPKIRRQTDQFVLRFRKPAG